MNKFIPVACFYFTARNAAQAHRLEKDEDRMLLYSQTRADACTLEERNLKDTNVERRKLDCMAAVHQREAKENSKAAEMMVSSGILVKLVNCKDFFVEIVAACEFSSKSHFTIK